MKKYSYMDYMEGECTQEQYHNQFNPIKLELNQIYYQNKGKWDQMVYQIKYIDNNIACARQVKGGLSTGNYCLFHVNTGFKYNDNRIVKYQLTKN